MTKHAATQTGGVPTCLHIEKVSAMIGKTETTIRTCATNEKYKHLIPKPFKMPHSRRLCWWEHEVLAWIESNCVFRLNVTGDFGIVTGHFGHRDRTSISAHRDRPFRHRDRPFRRS